MKMTLKMKTTSKLRGPQKLQIALAEHGNNLHALKQILYDMGHLTVTRWLFQEAWKQSGFFAVSPVSARRDRSEVERQVWTKELFFMTFCQFLYEC